MHEIWVIQGVAIWEKDMVSVLIHSCSRSTSDKEAFLYRHLQYSIDRSQRRKDYMYCTQQLGHHACCTCEVNGFVQIPSLHACCTHVACTSSYSFLMLVQYNMPSHNSAAIKASERNRYWYDPAVRLAKRAAERKRYRRGHRTTTTTQRYPRISAF